MCDFHSSGFSTILMTNANSFNELDNKYLHTAEDMLLIFCEILYKILDNSKRELDYLRGKVISMHLLFI